MLKYYSSTAAVTLAPARTHFFRVFCIVPNK